MANQKPAYINSNGSYSEMSPTLDNIVTPDPTTAQQNATKNYVDTRAGMVTDTTLTNGATALGAAAPVYITTAGTLAPADATTIPAGSFCYGICMAATAASAANVPIICNGIYAGALAGATPGAEFFVKNGGGITSTRPTALGSRIIKLGIARNATDLLVQIQDIGQLSST